MDTRNKVGCECKLENDVYTAYKFFNTSFRHYCPRTPFVLIGMKKDLRQSSAESRAGSRAFVPVDTANQFVKEVGKIYTVMLSNILWYCILLYSVVVK